MIRVADYVANFIYEQGVRNVFMLSGGGSIYLDDGVACHKGLKEICVRNEATAPMMAEAVARLNGGLGVVFVTTGPGGANAVSGLAEAWVDSAPILIISGQEKKDYTSHNNNLRTYGTQELDIVNIVKRITKYSVMVDDSKKIRYYLEKAVYYATHRRPGPVWIDIPLDIQSDMVDECELEGFNPPLSYTPKASESEVKDVLKLLNKANKPLVIFGQGVRISDCINDFKELLEVFQIPTISSRLGQDILPYSCKYNMGHGGTRGSYLTARVMKESDVILCLGSRLAVPFAGENFNGFSDDAKIIMIDIDRQELEREKNKILLPICSDLKPFIEDLIKQSFIEPVKKHSNWLEVCSQYKKDMSVINYDHERNPIDLYYFMWKIDSLSNEGHIFTSDAGSSYYVAGQMLRFENGQREITSGAFASMGLSIPLSIGCAIGQPNKQILAITGDGSIELNIQELKTISAYDLNIKIFVINNGGYVSIRNTQDKLFNGRYINSDQKSTNCMLDFKKVAEAFDLPYYLIDDYQKIDEKFREITHNKGPALVEVVCDNNQKIIHPYYKSYEC